MILRDLTDLVAFYGDAERDWIALEQDGRTATMRELARWMGSAAATLADGSDDVVAISTPDAIEHTVGFLGALAAGRRPMLVDPRHPDALLAEVVVRAGATTTVGRELPGVERRTFEELIQRPPVTRVRVPGETTGSLLLTSGSTGVPKIVVRSRAADLAAAHNFRLERFPVAPGDRFWLSAPFTGSPYPGVVWGCLLARTTVVFAALPEESIGEFLAEHRITATFLGPTATRLAYQRDGLEGPGWDQLRGVLSGGEKLDAPTADLMTRRWPGAVYLGYGMTEVSQISVAPEEVLRERPGSVGQPLPLHQAQIADFGSDEPVAVGEEGEILVRGPDMFTGYLGEEAAGEWFRTGDLGRFDPDGYLYVTGRASNIVQVGGNRVSTEEVAAVIRAHPEVANAAVIALDDSTWTTRLEAFVALRTQGAADAAALDTWVRERLPAYKVPRAYRILDELPTESAGKISLRALHELAARAPA
jgi:acyl-coenzyme A synthetase/AMP-(fatty) acid ligase